MMKYASLICVLCLLQLVNGACECGGGLQPVVPSNTIITPPSSHNGSFNDCNLISGLYHCSNNQLFNCSADSTDQYYVWNIVDSIIIADFTNPIRQVRVLMTYFIPDTSGEVRLSFPQTNGSHALSGTQLVPLPANEQQLNVTLPQALSAVNRIIVTQISGTVAINRITFCSEPEVSPSSTVSMTSTQTSSVTLSSQLVRPITPPVSQSPSTTMQSTVPTSSVVQSTVLIPSTFQSTMAQPITSMTRSSSSILQPTSSIPDSSGTSNGPSPTSSAGDTGDDSKDGLPLALLIGVIAIAVFLFLIVLLLSFILCFVCHGRSHSDKFTLESTDVVVDGYEMLPHDPKSTPMHVANGTAANGVAANGSAPNGLPRNDYDYPQLPMGTENSNQNNHPFYSTPEQTKSPHKGSSSAFPSGATLSKLESSLYGMPSTAASKASFSKVIENGEPVYYMLDKKYSFYERSKTLTATDEPRNLCPFSSIYDDPLPLKRSEAPNYVKPSDIREIKLLGNGQFGEVYLAEVTGLPASLFDGVDPSQGQPLHVAVKKLRGDSTDSTQKAFEREIKFMTRLKHKHVIRLLGICTDPSNPFIMIEYCRNGDLNQCLKSLTLVTGNLPPSKGQVTTLGLLSQCTQIASGMEYLSSLNFIHRDLATRNILVGEWNQVKIADFGMSQNLYDSDYYRLRGHAIVPIRWMATECFYGKFSVKSDVWAFGVVVWEIFTMCSQRPYEEMTDPELIQDAKYADSRKLLQQTEYCPDQVYQVLLRCWKSTPNERWTFTQLHDKFTRLCNGSTAI